MLRNALTLLRLLWMLFMICAGPRLSDLSSTRCYADPVEKPSLELTVLVRSGSEIGSRSIRPNSDIYDRDQVDIVVQPIARSYLYVCAVDAKLLTTAIYPEGRLVPTLPASPLLHSLGRLTGAAGKESIIVVAAPFPLPAERAAALGLPCPLNGPSTLRGDGKEKQEAKSKQKPESKEKKEEPAPRMAEGQRGKDRNGQIIEREGRTVVLGYADRQGITLLRFPFDHIALPIRHGVK